MAEPAGPAGPGIAGRRSRRTWFVLLPLLSTPLLYWAAWMIDTRALGVRVDGPGWPVDLLIQVAVGYLLLAFGRRGWAVVVEQALLMALFEVGSAAKVSFMGWPVTPDDLGAVHELLRILPGALELAVLLPVASFAVVFVLNLRLRRASAAAAILALAAIAAAGAWPRPVLRLLDGGLPHTVWNQAQNYRERGAGLYLVSEVLRNRMSRTRVPRLEQVAAAVARLRGLERPAPAPVRAGPDRNLYVVILESFWDPSLLAKAGFDRDPWFSGWRSLWRRGGPSWALSPEFGGATANPEFEVLCGIPTRLDLPGVVFKTSLKNQIPCVPALLAGRGWETWALHPNVPDFWNRSHAYRRIGFEHYLARPDLVLDDMNGPDLADASLYRQALEHTRPWTAGHPVMTYVMTITGHWPYPLNTKKRPIIVHATSRVREVEAYANSVYYSSRDLDRFIERVRAHDPDALIVALGDHLPVLGAKLAAYRESGLLPSAWTGDFTSEDARHLYSVPLLLVDGRRGPVRVGTVAQYDIPRLVLPRLGVEPPEWMRLMAPPHGWRVRTHSSAALILEPGGSEVICRSPRDAPECAEAAAWLDAVKVVALDLVAGRRYTLRLTGGEGRE